MSTSPDRTPSARPDVPVWARTPVTGPPVEGRVDADVAVIGAGITGLALAHELADRGASVALVARHPLGEGITGRSNAKITVLHQLVYADVARRHGTEAARTYAHANGAAVDWIRGRAGEAWQDRPVATVARTPEEAQQVADEAEAARAAGLDAHVESDVAFPDATRAVVIRGGQGQVDPAQLLVRLHVALPDGVAYRTDTVTGVAERRDGARVRTRTGTVRARHVVVATGLPIIDRGGFFALCEPQASYLVALRQDAAAVPEGEPMMITASEPKRSVRWTADADGPILLVGGEGHRTGAGSPTTLRYEALESWARQRYDGVGPVVARWSAEDFMSPDRLPFAGPHLRFGGPVHVVTGLSKWGFSLGVACATALAERLTAGRTTAWGELVDTARRPDLGFLATTAKANAEVGARMVRGWARAAATSGGAAPREGEGRVHRCGLRPCATATVDGEVLERSAVCTHLGGIVTWNDGDRTWDCPLHGSRFEADGAVRFGPAIRDI